MHEAACYLCTLEPGFRLTMPEDFPGSIGPFEISQVPVRNDMNDPKSRLVDGYERTDNNVLVAPEDHH
jgi:hypothetical protein